MNYGEAKADCSENTYCVYIHKTPSDKVYIGQTYREPQKRWGYGSQYKSNAHFTSAINKYGWENIEHEVLFDALDKHKADDLEDLLINIFRCKDRRFGYNKKGGGANGKMSEESKERNRQSQLGKVLSEETRNKMSESRKGHIVTEEKKKKISESKKGYKPTSETIAKISASQKGRKLSDETRRRMSESRKGRIVTEETRQKLSEAHKGKRHTKEMQAQIADKLRKPVLCVETGTIYPCAKDAVQALGFVGFGNIGLCCRGQRKKAYGFHWQYVAKEGDSD